MIKMAPTISDTGSRGQNQSLWARFVLCLYPEDHVQTDSRRDGPRNGSIKCVVPQECVEEREHVVLHFALRERAQEGKR
jgi:hypothetical protein